MSRVRLSGLLATMAFSLCAMPAGAQNVPIQVSAKQPILDQLGKPLSRANGGDYVQILFYNGQIFPPNSDGTPHTNNPVAYVSRIGHGVVAHTSTVGRFSASITKRSEAQIFARVWNTPTLDRASYYGDSQVFTPQQGKIFVPVIESTSIPIDPADDDGDGLNNSMEMDFGSNPNSIDSDGDGMMDYVEFRSGTDLTNNLSYLAMVEILPVAGQDDVVEIQWSSVEGYSYQLQYTTHELHDPEVAFVDINDVVTATGETASTLVTNGLPEAIKSFRVLLVE